MTPEEMKTLSDLRLNDAGSLIAAGRWAAAYYLSGYAAELALKVCIAERLISDDLSEFFEDSKLQQKCWTHDLSKLLEIAKMESDLEGRCDNDNDFRVNWQIVKDWTEKARYKESSQKQAEDLYDALVDEDHGVIPWIKQHWNSKQ